MREFSEFQTANVGVGTGRHDHGSSDIALEVIIELEQDLCIPIKDGMELGKTAVKATLEL